MTRAYKVDAKLCRGDGLCVAVCPKKVLEIADGKARAVERRVRHCLLCGQCMAVCIHDAIEVEGLSRADFPLLRRHTFTAEDFETFLAERRSVRTFKDQPVPRELLDRIARAASLAPMGFPPHTTSVLVLDRREDLDRLAADLRKGYGKLLEMVRNPFLRLIIRLKRGAETMHAMRTHVLRIVEEDNERFRERGEDGYLYGAPALLLFHANRWSVAYQESAMLVAAYAMLEAQALGLGTTVLSIVPPLINNMPGMREPYGLGQDDFVVVGLIVGYPQYKYHRSIERKLAAVRYLRP
ncbi:MAG: nitroreductase family protein [Deltaproteobacteria bacterium]|nr:nitroreductase family protein [Deltaproteobacteria bacterium]